MVENGVVTVFRIKSKMTDEAYRPGMTNSVQRKDNYSYESHKVKRNHIALASLENKNKYYLIQRLFGNTDFFNELCHELPW